MEDTKVLLLTWDLEQSAQENLDRALRENVLGKTSRKRLRDELLIFRQRYFSNADLSKALAILAQGGWPTTALNRLLYYLSARADRLLHDVVTDILVPSLRAGRLDVSPEDIQGRIGAWVSEGRTESAWSTYTIRRVAQGLLATLRDFDVLAGAVMKRIAPPFVPAEVAAFVAFMLSRDGIAAGEIAKHPDWQLFFLDAEGVERLLLDAHQRHLLIYQAAGRLVRIDFGADTIEGYARALT